MNPVSSSEDISKICTFNVGGEDFSFPKEMIEVSGHNFLSSAIKNHWKDQEKIFINANRKIFQKWIDPFIRFSILPDLDSIKDDQEKQTITATVNFLGLTVILEHINPPLPKLTEQVCFFGPEQWQAHYGDVGKAPPLPGNINEILSKPCPFRPELKIHEAYILSLIPEKVNGKELSINYMETLAKSPKKGSSSKYRSIWNELKAEHGDTKVPKSYWVLMSKKVLEQSRGKNRQTQLAFAKSDMGHQAPTLLEAIVCNFAHYVATGQRLLNDDPLRYTCCQEQTRGYKLVVGGFAPAGLFVDNVGDSDSVGVAPVLRKF